MGQSGAGSAVSKRGQKRRGAVRLAFVAVTRRMRHPGGAVNHAPARGRHSQAAARRESSLMKRETEHKRFRQPFRRIARSTRKLAFIPNSKHRAARRVSGSSRLIALTMSLRPGVLTGSSSSLGVYRRSLGVPSRALDIVSQPPARAQQSSPTPPGPCE